MSRCSVLVFGLLLLGWDRCQYGVSFSTSSLARRGHQSRRGRHVLCMNNKACKGSESLSSSRRDLLLASATFAVSTPALASVGTLPEFSDTNAIIQGITVNVVDKSQQDQMIGFLANAFDMQVLRKRIDQESGIEDTWMGYGPEQLSIPKDFELPVSSFAKYGGHASIHIRYDSLATSPLYKNGDQPPGNNIAFVQFGVPGYRISQMIKNGGFVNDAYGYVNAVAPCGIPVRGIVGIWPDPFMMVGVNCADVKKSAEFYQTLGFAEQEYPYCRLSKGESPFEPKQPRGSIYMAPSPNCVGVLLIPTKKKKSPTPNPVFGSLNIVYTPSASQDSSESSNQDFRLSDPSGVGIAFQSVEQFTVEEKITR